ncbi:MAG: UDP-N-acetylmuramoyl-L-alanine--D-glutamate ligase [Deltaproteobacteria bacterium]|nr:UDP-N-acetylmuramoyl-L-alanine--D-glutamate ligase [Deltaproteobacteria bacterium]MBT8481885.1 UDP-N-acetylmuramoyl-L-alanine--D-glutamate ligase [Deltaproteobacteria bacterium]NNK08099.1 UDP-N-acetylmuramoyl-L-alanine--D-glutamate ligase [Myxococcales bacterium]NNL24747.1 UDP-N-acetylmuramoyl-L-alanine--D-glutamate ligase [Myxococcales bacterium]
MVVGLGESGLAVVRFLTARGALVRVNDQRDLAELGAAAAEAEALGAELVLGGHPESAFENLDLIVVSPGVPPLAQLEEAERRGAQVVSEVELASRFLDAPIVAITGTNGKSTVTTLIGQMCNYLDRPIFVGGNLGRPMIEAAGTDAGNERGLVIVELSSFQLERVSEMRAHVALLLNVSADHLDRYPSFEAYAAAKARIFERQRAEDFAILPADAPDLRELIEDGGTLVLFGGRNGEVRVVNGALTDTQSSLRVPIAELGIRGLHNVANACAAALAARLLGVRESDIASVLREFKGLAHRMQYVSSVGGVEYIDDSKATNVGAAVASIDGLAGANGKIVLIAGGVDKGGSYEPLRQRMTERGRAVVVLGEAAPLLERAFVDSPLTLRHAQSMAEAVDSASAMAVSGDIVLLAPACSSFDMFRSYAERGDQFQSAVHSLGGHV